MAELRSYPINCRISDKAAARLKLLAKSQRKSFGELLDQMLLNIPIEQADWQIAVDQLATRISALEAGKVHAPEPEPTPSPTAQDNEKHGHGRLNRVELATLKPITQSWIEQFNLELKRPPTLVEISHYFWTDHNIGQHSDSGPIVPLSRSGTSAVLKKLNLKDDL